MTWQLIEFAPWNTEILVSDGKSVCSARYDGLDWDYTTDGNVVWEGSEERGGPKSLDFEPTHWMPLPDPPQR